MKEKGRRGISAVSGEGERFKRPAAWFKGSSAAVAAGSREREVGGRRGCWDFNAETRRRGEESTLNVERPTPNSERGSGDWEVLTAEMKRYEYDIGPTGQISYAAPSGYHDDCVMALALGVWGCRTFGVEPGRMLRLGLGCGGQRSESGGRRTEGRNVGVRTSVNLPCTRGDELPYSPFFVSVFSLIGSGSSCFGVIITKPLRVSNV